MHGQRVRRRVAQERLAEAGGSYPVALERARAAADAADAAVRQAVADAEGLEREIAEQNSIVGLCEELAADPVDLRGAVDVASADVRRKKAALVSARTELQIAERELGWATIKAPMDGRVLRLEAEPGDMVGHGEKGVVALYDPSSLRARIDVPLDSLAGLHVGQDVEIQSEAIGERVVKGVVQRLEHEADLLKNTLQIHVGLVDPPDLLRPEALCRARFLAPHRAGTTERATTRPSVAVHRVLAEAVRDGRVFVLDPVSGSARAVSVDVVGEDGRDRLVRGDLSVTHRVILDPVRAGDRVQEQQR